jgi:hypothetical protein
MSQHHHATLCILWMLLLPLLLLPMVAPSWSLLCLPLQTCAVEACRGVTVSSSLHCRSFGTAGWTVFLLEAVHASCLCSILWLGTALPSCVNCSLLLSVVPWPFMCQPTVHPMFTMRAFHILLPGCLLFCRVT